MFTLPNKKNIDGFGLEEALGDTDLSRQYFLDAKSGEIGCFNATDRKKIREMEAGSDRYFEIPHVPEITQLEWVREFCEMILEEDGVLLRRKMLRALKDGKNLRACIELIENDKNDWFYAWDSWRGDCLWEEAGNWLAELPIDVVDNWEASDDCELCKLMKTGEYTVEVFKKAAEKEKNKEKKKDQTES